jgi:hypothetical protein
MKTATLILSLFLFSCAGLETGNSSLSDKKIRELIVGTWICDPVDSRCYPSRSTYRRDGTLTFIRYKSRLCEIPINETKAIWRVENKKLIIIVRNSIGSVRYAPGLSIESEVVSISETAKTLKGNDDLLRYRIKSEKCLGTDL